MFEQKRLGDNGTRAARSEEFDDRGDEMNKQHDQVAHRAIVAISTSVTRLGYPQDPCDKSEIRHTQVGQDASTACCHRGRDECAAAGRMVRGSPTWVHPSIRFSETSIDTCLNSPTESCQIVSSTAVLKAAKTRISTPVCHLVVIAARVGRDSPALPACRASRCVRRRRAD